MGVGTSRHACLRCPTHLSFDCKLRLVVVKIYGDDSVNLASLVDVPSLTAHGTTHALVGDGHHIFDEVGTVLTATGLSLRLPFLLGALCCSEEEQLGSPSNNEHYLKHCYCPKQLHD